MVPLFPPKSYPAFTFLKMIDIGIKARTKSSGDKLSPWKIPRLIFTVPNITFPDVNSVSQFIILLLIKPVIFPAILNIPKHLNIHE